jgi:hypothetical protein
MKLITSVIAAKMIDTIAMQLLRRVRGVHLPTTSTPNRNPSLAKP